MKDRALLPEAGQFYKANLHCHTVLSDGRWTKEQVKAEYQKRGYSVVAFTDHRHYGWHPELMDETFIPLAAYEADLNEPFPPSGDFQRVRTYHLNFYDTHPETRTGFEAQQPPQRYGDLAALNEFLAGKEAEGFLCCYNHPYWSLQNWQDYKDLDHVFAMEIYNHGCQLDGLYGYAPQAYDEMLRTGRRLFCLSTDDNHNVYEPGDPPVRRLWRVHHAQAAPPGLCRGDRGVAAGELLRLHRPGNPSPGDLERRAGGVLQPGGEDLCGDQRPTLPDGTGGPGPDPDRGRIPPAGR